MADPVASSNPNDPIAQAIQAEAVAKQTYNDAGYRRNRLEHHIKVYAGQLQEKLSPDERKRILQSLDQAEAQLPEAQDQVETAQEDLKKAQTRLALLTGGKDPHRKQYLAYRTAKEAEEAAAKQKAVPEKPSTPVRIVEREFIVEGPKLTAAYIQFVNSESTRVLFNKTKVHRLHEIFQLIQEDLKKSPKTPQYKELIKKYTPLHGEMMTRASLYESRVPTLIQGVEEYLK